VNLPQLAEAMRGCGLTLTDWDGTTEDTQLCFILWAAMWRSGEWTVETSFDATEGAKAAVCTTTKSGFAGQYPIGIGPNLTQATVTCFMQWVDGGNE